MPKRSQRAAWLGVILIGVGLWGCRLPTQATDRDVAAAIAARQREALDYNRPVAIAADEAAAEPTDIAYEASPTLVSQEVPDGFVGQPGEGEGESAAEAGAIYDPEARATSGPTTRPVERYRERVLSLTDVLQYAQAYRREFQRAREDLYLAALALTLERHLWTPQFAADLRTVYGNFGEITDFDQATRFVADLSVAQRLPYGGNFTARAISTLIRDVKRTITAEESGAIELGLNVPVLRGAGHVAREQLIQLERELTYAVRSYERFRRSQLVDIAQAYFDLLRSKQAVIDANESVERAHDDFVRSQALEDAGKSSTLDTRRQEQNLLAQQNSLAVARESFRFATDTFKLLVGMPVDERIGLDDLEDIVQIETQIAAGRYPLLQRPPAADNEALAISTAEKLRLDLLSVADQIDDARRGVAVARNGLLPDLNWNSTLAFNTDPGEYNVANFEVARATWRSELILSMNDRFAERNAYRRALIDVRRAQREFDEAVERVRVEVRRAINQLALQDRLVDIQRRNLQVAELRAEFSRIQYEEGEISNRDLVEAETALLDAQNQLNQAKTARWSALLDFQLAADTLRVPEAVASAELE